jgi:hypothetical protein
MLSNRPPQPIRLDAADVRSLIAGRPVSAVVMGQRVEIIAEVGPGGDPAEAYELLPRRRRKVPQ